MENSLIEKLDKSRYNLIKWFTIGWTIWFGGFIIKDFVNNKLIFVLIVLIGLVGWIIFSLNLIRLRKLGKIINADVNLKNALNDELMLHNRNKSFVVGHWTFTILIGIFYGLSMLMDISAQMVCGITLFVGVLSTLVSSLIFNRS